MMIKSTLYGSRGECFGAPSESDRAEGLEAGAERRAVADAAAEGSGSVRAWLWHPQRPTTRMNQ